MVVVNLVRQVLIVVIAAFLVIQMIVVERCVDTDAAGRGHGKYRERVVE